MMALLNEKDQRYYSATEALAFGYGGVAEFSRVTGISRDKIYYGIEEIETGNTLTGERIRRPGAGRKKKTEKMPKLSSAIELEAVPKTDKRVIIKWTTHSIKHIRTALKHRGFFVGVMTIYRILKEKGYALRANKKDVGGGRDHPDRDKQFRYINMMGLKMQVQGFPILSIDAKNTEKIGNFKMKGEEWMPSGESIHVNDHDFGVKDKRKKGRIMKAIPYGVYDVVRKRGFVNVGIDHNTAELAGESLFRYWTNYGKKEYAGASEILLFCDSGSANGSRNRLWKVVLQDVANRTGLTMHVCHYPPGTSKWNDIEHEMFSYITINWRARPLTAYEVVLEQIRNTTTETGLKIHAVLDENDYETKKGKEIADEDIDALNIEKHVFHGEWNYTVRPQAEMQVLN